MCIRSLNLKDFREKMMKSEYSLLQNHVFILQKPWIDFKKKFTLLRDLFISVSHERL